MGTEDMLNEREKTHGDFEEVAVIAGTLRGELMRYENAKDFTRQKISNSQKMALEMICLKIARIICGDPNFDDHWDDIAGYAMLGKGKEVIRQEDMHATAKAGQSFKFEDGKFLPSEGFAYCSECDATTQHEDGFCLRESCKKEGGGLASTSSKMEHVQEKTFWCVGCEKEKTGKPRDVGIMKDGMPLLNCDDCLDKLIKGLREHWSQRST